jgi:hypothetical protein
MEKRSRRRIRDLVARPASLGLSENEIGCARISMMARNTNVPFKGRIQKRKTYHLQIITFRLQRAAGPYRSAITGREHMQQTMCANARLLDHSSKNREQLRRNFRPSALADFSVASKRPPEPFGKRLRRYLP